MIRFKMLVAALITVLVGYCLTDLLVLEVSLKQFLLIELVIVFTHGMYNYVKKDCLTN